MKSILFLLPLSLILNACCCDSSQDGMCVSTEVQQRTGYDVEWQKNCLLENQANERVAALLSQELTLDSVVQISLLNNPSIQSQFESIGISRAQYLAAMTPRNPIFYWEVERQYNPFSSTLDIQGSLTGFLWDLFLIPHRKRAAAIALKQQELQVAQSFLDLILQIKTAFYQLQAAEDQFLAKKLFLSESEHLKDSKDISEQSRYEVILVDYYTSELNVDKLKEDLNQLMGFECAPVWQIDLTFPVHKHKRLTLCDVIQLALANRLELQNNRWAICGLLEKEKLQEWWTYLDPQIGPMFENDPDRSFEVGFSLTHVFPIFNYGQWDRKQIFFQVKQLWHQYQMTRIQIVSATRLAFIRLEKHEELLHHFEENILPLINTGHEPDNKIDPDVIERLGSLEQQYRELQRDYWIHHAELENAVGGSLILQMEDAI